MTVLALVLAATLAIACVLYVARPFLLEPAAPHDRLDELDDLERRRLELAEERDRALAALKDLEFDHRTNAISDDDYRALVGPLRRRAAEALRALDPPRAGSKPQAPPREMKAPLATSDHDRGGTMTANEAKRGSTRTTPGERLGAAEVARRTGASVPYPEPGEADPPEPARVPEPYPPPGEADPPEPARIPEPYPEPGEADPPEPARIPEPGPPGGMKD